VKLLAAGDAGSIGCAGVAELAAAWRGLRAMVADARRFVVARR